MVGFMKSECKVVVTGDVTIEWRLAQSQLKDSLGPLLDPCNYMQLTREPIGATLLADIIDEAISLTKRSGQKAFDHVRVLAANRGGDGRSDPFDELAYQSPFWHSYIVCNEQPRERGDKDHYVWRVKERLGIDRKPPNSLSKEPEMLRIEGDTGDANLIVAEHSQQGFFYEGKALESKVQTDADGPSPLPFWPASLKNPTSNPYILVEWTQPSLEKENPTAFWKYLTRKFPSRIVIVVRIDDLRLFGMRISRGFSWERTVEELCYELNLNNGAFDGCAHMIVSFGLSGAVLYSANANTGKWRKAGNWEAKLFYEPQRLEGQRADGFGGAMTGVTRCLTAGIALELMLREKAGTLSGAGVKAGLVAAQSLWHDGFLNVGKPKRSDTNLGEELRFPTKAVAAAIVATLSHDETLSHEAQWKPSSIDGVPAWAAECEKTIVSVPIPDEVTRRRTPPYDEGGIPPGKSSSPTWSILSRSASAKVIATEDLLKEAAAIVRDGHAPLLLKVPTAKIGKVFVTNRKELEDLRTLRELIRNYIASPTISTPLAIAVFGKPGSGKSFAIKELANELAGDPKKLPLTFNLSQFANANALLGALQRVQDESSTGSVPLVFWDEFDTNFQTRFGWLRYFLAPMQDGQFQDGAVTHNVGRSIFVFAGGICETMQDFRREMEAAKKDKHSPLRDAKLSDFISRLKGYVDVPDLNYPHDVDPKEKTLPSLDPAIVLRRAHLLRYFLKDSAAKLTQLVPVEPKVAVEPKVPVESKVMVELKVVVEPKVAVEPRVVEPKAPVESKVVERLNIDYGLAKAFLSVGRYRYGARSMEAIVKMSALSGKTMFDRSSLPPKDQLDLHVDAKAFLTFADRYWADTP
jgi:hypothetical protein